MVGFVRTVALGVGLIGGVTASQLPEFAQQYTQRLGGTVDELAAQVARFDADARAHGLDRVQAVQRLTANADPLAQARALAAQDMIGRFERLEPHYRAMRLASGVERAMTLVKADPDIARRAFADFRPAVPVTMDGAWAAAFGFLAGLLAIFGLSGATKRVGRALRKRTPVKPTTR